MFAPAKLLTDHADAQGQVIVVIAQQVILQGLPRSSKGIVVRLLQEGHLLVIPVDALLKGAQQPNGIFDFSELAEPEFVQQLADGFG